MEVNFGKVIIKNFGKFNNLKLAKGLKLESFKTIPRRNAMTGISTENFGNVWFVLPKGNAIFKTYDSFHMRSIKNVRMVNELLCQELCKMMGIECAEYEVATHDGQEGLVSYNVIKSKNERIISMYDFVNQAVSRTSKRNLFACLETVDQYIERGFNIDREKFITDIYKMIVFDSLTFQTDRHIGNIHLIINDKEKSIRVSPLIDNELAFGGHSLVVFKEDDKPASLREFLDEYSLDAKQFAIYENYKRDDIMFKHQCDQIHKFAEENEGMKDIMQGLAEKCDIAKAIMNLKTKGVKISPDYVKFVLILTEYAKARLTNPEFSKYEDKKDEEYLQKQLEEDCYYLDEGFELFDDTTTSDSLEKI